MALEQCGCASPCAAGRGLTTNGHASTRISELGDETAFRDQQLEFVTRRVRTIPKGFTFIRVHLCSFVVGLMNISAPFIRRPVGTSLLAFGLFLTGLVAYRFMPVAAIPRVDFPMVTVSASLPGADPATVASSLATPLERRLGQIAGVSEMTSVSTLGGCSITIQFDLDRKVDDAAHDVQAAINAAATDLPINLPHPPTYRKVNPADAPILIMALTSKSLPQSDIFEFADSILGQKLSQIEGVSQAFISGAEKSAVRVQVNPGALAAANVSLEDVRSTLSQVNVNLPLGSLDGDGVSHTIVINGQLTDARPYQQLVLRQTNNIPIRLDAFGRAVEGVENDRLAGWSGTNRAVLVIVFKQAGANVIQTVDRIKAALPQMERWMPPGANLSVAERPHRYDPFFGERGAVRVDAQRRAGHHGHLRLSAPVLADVHRQCNGAARALRHGRLHVVPRLQH